MAKGENKLVEQVDTVAFEPEIFTTDVSRSGDLMDVRKMPNSDEFGLQLIAPEVEYGIPTADVTADSDTVTLQPCDSVGAEYDDADTIDVYVCNDRSEQVLVHREWVATDGETVGTILSFVRFPEFGPDADGVLIGEGSVDAVVIPDDTYSMQLDKEYTFSGDVSWTTIDTRDWRGRWISITMIDSDTDIDEFADDDVEHWDSIAAAYAKQSTQPHAWFQVLLHKDYQSGGVSAAQPISRDIFSPGVLDSGDFYMRMKTDGKIEIMVENWTKQFSVRFSIKSNGTPPTNEALG
jgi:hypothetical protein